jgi:hypothetical protein
MPMSVWNRIPCNVTVWRFITREIYDPAVRPARTVLEGRFRLRNGFSCCLQSLNVELERLAH